MKGGIQMSLEDNKAAVSRVYDLLNQREIEAAYEPYAPECVFHMADGDLSVKQSREFDAMLLAAFPDVTLTIIDIIAEGDKVAFRVKLKGTNTGEFMGNPPTGKKLDIINSNWVRVVDGKWVEFWATMDRLSMMQQLGVIPKM
jgi:predicted ester cyclase